MRIKYLDGLRGIAILLVLFFHAFSRWSTHVPYGDAYKNIPFFEFGWLGVNLFFIISGFVIFMSLDHSTSIKQYLYKRWLRLFPAMLIASILIYISLPLFSQRPMGIPSLSHVLPGLTFIESDWWSRILGTNIQSLEGAFWSIYVEFKFYIVVGVLYFFCGRKYLVPCLVSLFIFSLIVSGISDNNDTLLLKIMRGANKALSLEFFGWFASGSAFYLYYQNKDEKWFTFALFLAILSSIFVEYRHIYITCYALIISGLFAFSIKSKIVQSILQSKILLFMGFISYPLYLIHENAMIAIIIQSSEYLPWLPMVFYPFVAITLLALVAYIIAEIFEPITRKIVKNIISHVKTKTLLFSAENN